MLGDMPSASLVAQYWSFVAVAFVVYLLGESSKRLAVWIKVRPATVKPTSETPPEPDTLVAHLYDVSLPIQPLVVGAFFGFVPLPVPQWVGADIFAHCGWFLLAGALCGQVYEAVKRAIWKVADVKASRATSVPPPPAPAAHGHDDEDGDGGSPAR